jgi:hypothetical protein
MPRNMRERCLFCGVTGEKHQTKCDLYHSMEPSRCAVQHDWFLQSCGGGDPYGYVCNFCNIAPILCESALTFPDHPFCALGQHRYNGGCGDGCCPSECRCGAIEFYP